MKTEVKIGCQNSGLPDSRGSGPALVPGSDDGISIEDLLKDEVVKQEMLGRTLKDLAKRNMAGFPCGRCTLDPLDPLDPTVKSVDVRATLSCKESSRGTDERSQGP